MTVALTPVDAVDVTLVMDLSLDILMAGQEGVQRFKLAYDWSDHDSLLAEHGFSALVTVEFAGRRHSVLYDGGLSALEGIRAATQGSAAALGLADVGTVTAGAQADLIVVDGDPVADVRVLNDPSRITMVMKAGALVKGSGETVVAQA